MPHLRNEGLIEVFAEVYNDPDKHWDEYNMCEKLVDVEEQFPLWRFQHMNTVERIIRHKPGMGGTAGVPYLEQVLNVRLFPELIDVRATIDEFVEI